MVPVVWWSCTNVAGSIGTNGDGKRLCSPVVASSSAWMLSWAASVSDEMSSVSSSW